MDIAIKFINPNQYADVIHWITINIICIVFQNINSTVAQGLNAPTRMIDGQ